MFRAERKTNVTNDVFDDKSIVLNDVCVCSVYVEAGPI